MRNAPRAPFERTGASIPAGDLCLPGADVPKWRIGARANGCTDRH